MMRDLINLIERCLNVGLKTLAEATLAEAPLADFETFGDLDQAGSFRDDDLRAMRNPKWRAKVYRAFEATPYQFNIYVYNGPEGMAPLGRGVGFDSDPIKVNDLRNLGKYVGVQKLRVIRDIIGKVPPNAAESITVLLVENEGSERLALTPWILAHRVGHAILYAGQGRDTLSTDPDIKVHNTELTTLFTNVFNSVEKSLERSAHHGAAIKTGEGENDRLNNVAKLLGTFRSARMGNLTSTGEFVVEMIAQFMVKGRVTFQRPMMDEHGLTQPPGPEIDADLLALARQAPRDKDGFVQRALHQKYGFKNPPTRPRTEPSYTAYDADGDAYASFGPSALAKYEAEAHRVEQKPPPSKQAIRRYETYQARRNELYAMWNMFLERDLLFPAMTATDDLHLNLANYEERINAAIDGLLQACVGKAIVL